jgi:hypothetical protein
VKRRRDAKDEAQQRTLDCDLQKIPEQAVPYSHNSFCRAAIEWVVATDQVSCIVSDPLHRSFLLFTAHHCARTP